MGMFKAAILDREKRQISIGYVTCNVDPASFYPDLTHEGLQQEVTYLQLGKAKLYALDEVRQCSCGKHIDFVASQV